MRVKEINHVCEILTKSFNENKVLVVYKSDGRMNVFIIKKKLYSIRFVIATMGMPARSGTWGGYLQTADGLHYVYVQRNEQQFMASV